MKGNFKFTSLYFQLRTFQKRDSLLKWKTADTKAFLQKLVQLKNDRHEKHESDVRKKV